MSIALRGTLDERSRVIRDKIRGLPGWHSACTVGLFAAMPDEPDLLDLMNSSGKTFAFPCIAGDTLVWRAATRDKELSTLRPNMPYLREPQLGPSIAERQIQLLLVPGLAFTRHGLRLGRGGGFYDRALPRFPKTTLRAGVCFQFQLLESLPTEPHDQAVDFVLHD